MQLLSTTNFRENFALLTKRPDAGYGSCRADIIGEFRNLTISDVAQKHYLVREMGKVRVIKLRIQNTELGLSSAAGYRLIIVCNQNERHNHVCLISVYPKKGKHGKVDLTKNEFRDILNAYGGELTNNALVLWADTEGD